MSPTPNTEGHPDPMTIAEIAVMVGRSRQLIHRLAVNDKAFPQAILGEGSTRPRYSRDAVARYWADREANMRQGRRTDLEEKREAE